ncbi:MAG: hypothetical protein WC728_11490 [Elusimicrobiota bacterium]
MKMARLMEMPEREAEELARSIEASPLFKRMSSAGIILSAQFPSARIAARRFAGYGLRISAGDGLPELVDGNCDIVRLMRKVGQGLFEEWFLGDRSFSDEDRAHGCEIAMDEARKLREFMDRAFIQSEFEGPAPEAPERVFSTVAGIEVMGGRPMLAFFHRDIWEKRYRIDREGLQAFLHGMAPREVEQARGLLSSLEAVEQRKTTLYRLLEEVLKAQAKYLLTGEPGRRIPLTQKLIAATLERHPSVINRLISNKSVQMPWGLEAPLSIFFPNGKEINREKLYALACSNPGWRDEDLRKEMERLYGVLLSRRSIAQYRKDLSLGGRNQRASAASL